MTDHVDGIPTEVCPVAQTSDHANHSPAHEVAGSAVALDAADPAVPSQSAALLPPVTNRAWRLQLDDRPRRPLRNGRSDLPGH